VPTANGQLKVAELLIQRGAIVDMLNDKQKTPPDKAAGHGKVEITRLLINNGANLHANDGKGWTRLPSASLHGYLAEVDPPNKWGWSSSHWTPIHLSAGNGTIDYWKVARTYMR
jgi:hypothetical protein